MASLKQQKICSDEAVKWISLALDLHSNKPKEALDCYLKGAEYLRKGLSLSFTPSERESAELLKKKMKKNLELVEEQLQRLQCSLSHLSAAEKSSAVRKGNSTSGCPPSMTHQTLQSPQAHAANVGVAVRPAKPKVKARAKHPSPVLPSKTSEKMVVQTTASSRREKEARPSPQPAKPLLHRKNATQKRSHVIGSNQSVPSMKHRPSSQDKSKKQTSLEESKKIMEKELKSIDKKLQQIIMSEILDESPAVAWEDVGKLSLQ